MKAETKQLNKNGEWEKATPEPYYPTFGDRVRCFFGKHIWFYKQSGMLRWFECLACKKEIYAIGEDRI